MNVKYDIIVAGGGFAGTCAAIAAARQQKSVLLIEKYNCLGGAGIFDLVNPFMRYRKYRLGENGEKSFDRFLSAGIFTEIREKLIEMNGLKSSNIFNEECLKVVLNRLCIEAGVNLLFGTEVVSVNKSGNMIESVEIYNVGGRSTLSAEIYIDATGDGNLAFMADIPFRLGRDGDNLCQPMTLCFRLAGVDMRQYEIDRPEINPLYKKYREAGKIKNPRENVLVFYTCHDGILHFNTTRVCGLNPTDAYDVTKAEIEAREQVFEMISFLKENFSSFADAYLISTGMQIGARESRMIEGLYTLTEDDVVSCRKFEDGIASCNYDIDIHSPDGTGTYIYMFPADKYYTIPYRCLVPVGCRNLLVAGRCISSTHEAQSSYRIMPTCASIGEAAGTAAAICCTSHRAPGDIDIGLLRETLRTNGAAID